MTSVFTPTLGVTDADTAPKRQPADQFLTDLSTITCSSIETGARATLTAFAPTDASTTKSADSQWSKVLHPNTRPLCADAEKQLMLVKIHLTLANRNDFYIRTSLVIFLTTEKSLRRN